MLTIPHIAWGRILITLGIINGGLGLQLKHASMTLDIAYGAVAGVMWLAWMACAFRAYMLGKREQSKDRDLEGKKLKIVKLHDYDEDTDKLVELQRLPTNRPSRPAR